MAEARVPREFEARSKQERDWRPADTLPSPTPEPGYTYRYVRIASNGQDDPTNVSGKLREGWEPVKAEDHPELQLYAIAEGRFKGGVEVGGLLLMKTPTRLVEQRNMHYNRQTQGQMEAVDSSLMKENDPRMPLFNERKTRVTFGKG
jgi:hypothetical protein